MKLNYSNISIQKKEKVNSTSDLKSFKTTILRKKNKKDDTTIEITQYDHENYKNINIVSFKRSFLKLKKNYSLNH